MSVHSLQTQTEDWQHFLYDEDSLVQLPVEERDGRIRVVRRWADGRGLSISYENRAAAQEGMRQLLSRRDVFLEGEYRIDVFLLPERNGLRVNYWLRIHHAARDSFLNYVLPVLFEVPQNKVGIRGESFYFTEWSGEPLPEALYRISSFVCGKLMSGKLVATFS